MIYVRKCFAYVLFQELMVSYLIFKTLSHFEFVFVYRKVLKKPFLEGALMYLGFLLCIFIKITHVHSFKKSNTSTRLAIFKKRSPQLSSPFPASPKPISFCSFNFLDIYLYIFKQQAYFYFRRKIISPNTGRTITILTCSDFSIGQPHLIYLFIYLFVYLFLAALGLHCCTRAFSSCSERGLLFVAVHGLLIAVASLVVEHGLQVRGLQQLWLAGSRAQAQQL